MASFTLLYFMYLFSVLHLFSKSEFIHLGFPEMDTNQGQLHSTLEGCHTPDPLKQSLKIPQEVKNNTL